jgi:aminopeptidase N
VHTKLDVSFDYAKRYLNGKAWITLKPHFYATDTLTLDAKGMDIKSIAVVGAKTNTPLKYKYDNEQLFIKLNKKYVKDEKYTIYIAYTAKPDELKTKGSVAITDAKGLYFINPDGAIKDKPIEIWTQGETEANSAWFPTIDKPNQKTTNEIAITVQAKYTTLSNGKLVSQKSNANGTRTDVWKQDQPHAPYLFMMAVGPFKVYKDTWKGKEVSYYLEPKYAPYAKQIFGKTPDMMTFYSNLLGVDYPWVKYGQVVARDYVSGAMENTSATLHGEHVQKTDRELLDGNQEGTIAHELFHQWFGDYVTAESWSNLTMNESFATFGEVVWHKHDDGVDAEARSRYEKLANYLRQVQGKNGISPALARYTYNDKEDMFDNVTYSKGSIILWALKAQMGDEAFYKGLQNYLKTNAYKTGEPQQLRIALEEVSGKDWAQYFNQWWYNGGHPILDVKYSYDKGKATVKVKQIQDANVQAYILPIKIDYYLGGQKVSKQISINQREQAFSFDIASKPEFIDFDVEKTLVGEINEDKTLDDYIYQYTKAPSYKNRIEALKFAVKSKDARAQSFFLQALKDQQDDLRIMAINALNLDNIEIEAAPMQALANMAKTDKVTAVRAAALNRLAVTGNVAYKDLMVASTKDRSYTVIGAGILGLSKLAPKEVPAILSNLDADTKDHIAVQVSTVYAQLGDDAYNDYFLKIVNDANQRKLASIVGAYHQFLLTNRNPQITAIGTAAIIANMNRTKLTQYYGKRFVETFKAAAQTKKNEASAAKDSGEKEQFLKQASIFAAAAEELAKAN